MVRPSGVLSRRKERTPMTTSADGPQPAPDFPTDLDWINSSASISLSDLRGKFVLLDFWTYG
jgi:hypothetical protein